MQTPLIKTLFRARCWEGSYVPNQIVRVSPSWLKVAEIYRHIRRLSRFVNKLIHGICLCKYLNIKVLH